MKPILSIAVPCYNVESYLRKGLDSCADARFRNRLQVIIVNDGSTDGTEELAREYVERYPDIFILVNQKNRGHGGAVNTALARAEGIYFRIVDGDDWICTENMPRLLEALAKTDCDLVVDVKREVDMVTGSGIRYLLPSGIETGRAYAFSEVCKQQEVASYLMIHTLTVRTRLLKESNVHLTEHVFYEDYEYVVKATCAGRTIRFLDLEIYEYLVGNAAQSVSSANYVKRYRHHDTVLKELLRFYSEESAGFPVQEQEYLLYRLKLLVHTQYKIALIYNRNRREGAAWAGELRDYLKEHAEIVWRLSARRYYVAKLLHCLRFDEKSLSRLRSRS